MASHAFAGWRIATWSAALSALAVSAYWSLVVTGTLLLADGKLDLGEFWIAGWASLIGGGLAVMSLLLAARRRPVLALPISLVALLFASVPFLGLGF